MNCKPGDLAMMVRSDFPQNIGALLRVLRADCLGQWLVETLCNVHSEFGIDPPGSHGFALDVDLRPIRPGDISDEEVHDLYAPKLPEVA